MFQFHFCVTVYQAQQTNHNLLLYEKKQGSCGESFIKQAIIYGYNNLFLTDHRAYGDFYYY